MITSLFVPKLKWVHVEGNRHHDKAAIMALANVAPGDPFIWVTRGRVERLTADPWVLQTLVIRQWPDGVTLLVREREPALTDGVTTWADDGTVLSGATPAEMAGLPLLEGWGQPRISEALTLNRLLESFGVEVISYSPEGFEIHLTDTELFTPTVEALREQWAAFVHHRGGRIAVYPWGVSKSDE